MTAIQDAVDAEFPGVGNVYGDRLGRLAIHGRYARFDPLGTEAMTAGWDFHDWKAGDGAGGRRLAHGHRAYPRLLDEPRRGQGHQPGAGDSGRDRRPDVDGQVVEDATSICSTGSAPGRRKT